MLSKRDKRLSMSDTAFAREAIREAFSPIKYGSVKAAQGAAYDFMRPLVVKNFRPRRVRQLWEGKATRVDGEEKDALRRAKIEETKREYRELKHRLAVLESTLARIDQKDACDPLDTGCGTADGLGRTHLPKAER